MDGSLISVGVPRTAVATARDIPLQLFPFLYDTNIVYFIIGWYQNCKHMRYICISVLTCVHRAHLCKPNAQNTLESAYGTPSSTNYFWPSSDFYKAVMASCRSHDHVMQKKKCFHCSFAKYNNFNTTKKRKKKTLLEVWSDDEHFFPFFKWQRVHLVNVFS